MRRLIIANWKMYPENARDATKLFLAVERRLGRGVGAEVVIAPPFPYLASLPRGTKTIRGAQDVFWERYGAFTGEVSGSILKSFGVKYVIVGHSERRTHLGETDMMVNKKLRHALAVGLRPILCIGERKRDADGVFFAVLKKQIQEDLTKVQKSLIARVVIAYEPLWAISPGRPTGPRDANEAILFIRKVIAQLYGLRAARTIRILYGGSVNAKNASEYFKEREIDGLLVGKESRDPREFIKIVQCAKAAS